MHLLHIVATFCVILNLTVHGLAKPCHTQILTASSGEFSSAGYPNSVYPNAQRCRFVIKAEPGNLIEITFTKFELESPHKGRRTEFVKIIDGFGKHPSQVVYYDGIRKTPFIFVSQTRGVTIVLVTNGQDRGTGFHATYRQITPALKDPLYCGYPDIKNWWGKCGDEEDQEDKDEEKLYDHCDITCDSDFQLVGTKTAKCNTDIGEWTDLPQCAMRPDVLETCLKDITNDDCLYSAEMLADHYMKETADEEDEKQVVALMEEFGDEMPEFDMEDTSSVAKTVVRNVKCARKLCNYNWSKGAYKVSCLNRSFKRQKRKHLNEVQRTDWMVICFQCQDKGCGTIQIYV